MHGWDLAPERLSPHASLEWAWALAMVWMGVWLLGPVRLWLRQLRRARAARAAELGQVREGLVVLAGVISTDGVEPAITISIEQRAVLRRANSRSYLVWKETRRSVNVHPFHLVKADGHRVRVEPDQRVFLVDKLETRAQSGASRVRTATLVDGEPAHIIGVLEPGFDREGPYRDSIATRVLRPERGGRMLISTEPLVDRHRKRARFHGWWAVGIAAFSASLYLLLCGSYLALSRHGRVVTATVHDASTYVVHDKNGAHTHWAIAVSYLDSHDRVVWLTNDVRRAIFSRVQPGAKVPVVVWERTGLTQLGDQPTLGVIAPIMALTFWPALLSLYLLLGLRTRPWYDCRRVDESERGLPASRSSPTA